jgi:ATP-dependent DNA ligase
MWHSPLVLITVNLRERTAEDSAAGPEGIVSKGLFGPYRSGRSRDWIEVKNSDRPGPGKVSGNCMTIDAAQSAIRLVIANALVENGEASGRGFDALFAMRQAEAIVRALEFAGYEIRPRT